MLERRKSRIDVMADVRSETVLHCTRRACMRKRLHTQASSLLCQGQTAPLPLRCSVVPVPVATACARGAYHAVPFNRGTLAEFTSTLHVTTFPNTHGPRCIRRCGKLWGTLALAARGKITRSAHQCELPQPTHTALDVSDEAGSVFCYQ